MTTFHDAETGIDSGRPVRLYQFMLQTARWFYTSADRVVDHLAATYSPVAISDDGIRQSGQASADTLKITVPSDLDIVSLYRGVPPSTPMAVTVYQRHYGIDAHVVVWSGEVAGVKWKDSVHAELSCIPLTSKMGKMGLRLAYERTCPHTLYSARCGVSREQYRVDATIQDMDGASIGNDIFAAVADGHYTAGLLEWLTRGGWTERRGIERHVGRGLRLLGGTSGLAPGMAVRVYPGCLQTVESCKKFGNLLNYGGIPHLAGESPFGRNIF